MPQLCNSIQVVLIMYCLNFKVPRTNIAFDHISHLSVCSQDHLEAEPNRDSPQPTDDSTRDQSSSHTDGVTESASQTHIGDIDGLTVEEVAKRIVADALSRAIQNHCVYLDTNSVCDG